MGVVFDFLKEREKRTKTFDERWHFLNGADLAKELPPDNWLIEALGICAPGVTIVGGGGFGGKTMAIQDLLLSIATGQKVWGQHDARSGEVVHLDWDQGPLTIRRYQRLARAKGIDLESLGDKIRVSCLPDAYLEGEDGESAMMRICKGKAVCAIDAFRGAFPKADENSSTVREYVDMLKRVSVATDCAIILICHSRKMGADKDVRSSLRGSGSIFDAADTVFMVDGAGKFSVVHNTKARVDGQLRETFGLRILDVVNSVGETNRRWGLEIEYMHPCEVQAETINVDDNSVAINADRVASAGQRILELVSRSAHGLTLQMVRAMVSGTPSIVVSAALSELVQGGEIREDGKGTSKAYVLRGRQPGEEG